MLNKYDNLLNENKFYQLHPSYLPYIGDDYEKYRILHIGESHYCSELDFNVYGVEYFLNWFNDSCEEVEDSVLGNNITRKVIDSIISGQCYCIFDNVLRSFYRVLLQKEVSLSAENRKAYSYFAYMNFYPLPSFEIGGSFASSLPPKKHEPKRDDLLNLCRSEGTKLVDAVIDAINPKCVVFTSYDAWSSYIANKGKYANSDIMIYTCHPNNRTWRKSLKSLNYERGIDVLEKGLKRIFGKI